MSERIEFFSGVLLLSREAARLARFYRDVLGVLLEEEHHDDLLPHWGCTMGDVHFAVHPVEDFPESPATGVGAVKLAFTVFDLDSMLARLRGHGIEILYEPRDVGFGRIAAFHDPDGNLVELTQLADRWFEHLARRRDQGHDLLARWRAQHP